MWMGTRGRIRARSMRVAIVGRLLIANAGVRALKRTGGERCRTAVVLKRRLAAT